MTAPISTGEILRLSGLTSGNAGDAAKGTET